MMVSADLFDRLGRGWRGPILAALLALIAGLPGALRLPPLDRDESRFAEASAQMLESGDFTSPRFQDLPRFKKPVGIYWLQALAVATLSHVEDRDIWAYRVPSLLGAMLAAGACVWGVGAFTGAGPSLIAGLLFAGSFMLSTEAAIAATDAVLCGSVTLSMAALGRLYLASKGGPPAGRRVRICFWFGLGLSILVKGPIGPMVVGLALLFLCLWDRSGQWLAKIGWGWGLVALAAALGPWALAITVATDGGFWGAALGDDLAPKLVGDAEGHGAPPGFYLLLTPILLFPAGLFLPAVVVLGWRNRAEPAVRFALCWLCPSWILFEVTPTKLIHYTLPLYGALAWLIALVIESRAEIARPIPITFVGRGPRVRSAGVLLTLAVGGLFAALPFAAMAKVGDWTAVVWATVSSLLALGAAAGGSLLYWRGNAGPAAALAATIAALGHGALAGGVAPLLHPLWISSAANQVLDEANASPWQGVMSGPITVAGYAEPSLVFLLGADTELAHAPEAASAIFQGRPAIVEDREERGFQAALAARGVTPRRIGMVSGLDYSTGRPDILRLYRPPSLYQKGRRP